MLENFDSLQVGGRSAYPALVVDAIAANGEADLVRFGLV